ncbi:MAG TPA: hypothetical protein VGF48_06225 [Thermoanaerobaculia bacterium]|jgi:Ca2+-binding EF-hand superfamily protein
MIDYRKTISALALTLFVAAAPSAFAVKENKGKVNGKRRNDKQTRSARTDAGFNQYFNQFDTNRDGRIARSEFPGDSNQFALVDSNRDGVISRTEAQAIASNRNVIENEVRRLDTNRDGVVSRNEWRGEPATFDRLDRNNDGVLSQADRQNHNSSTPQRQQQLYRGVDRNGDGIVTRSEWTGNDQSFRQHDRNNDGVLSGGELSRQR